jgi:GDP-L-fucose synthase
VINKKSKIFITGHKGMVGSSLVRIFEKKGYLNLITVDKRSLDLKDQKKVFNFLNKKKPDAIINAAGKVGGILANKTFKAEFIYDNLAIQNNIIHGAYLSGVKNLIFLGSSCIYPMTKKTPIKEEDILNGKLEETNEAYAIAKIAGLKMCCYYNEQYNLNYKCLMPPNLYGPNDNYDSLNSHFIPALIKKIVEANLKKEYQITLWGTGKPKREIMYVDDLAEACLFFLKKKKTKNVINVGTGIDYSIKDIALKVIKILDSKLTINFDYSKPDGVYRKLLNSNEAKKHGWKSKITLHEGIKKTYNSYLKSI